jgi:hypothetical protein
VDPEDKTKNRLSTAIDVFGCVDSMGSTCLSALTAMCRGTSVSETTRCQQDEKESFSEELKVVFSASSHSIRPIVGGSYFDFWRNVFFQQVTFVLRLRKVRIQSSAQIPAIRCAHPQFLLGGGGRLILRIYIYIKYVFHFLNSCKVMFYV